jgi:predicted ATPase/DNA-binding winged helix-turn-helix (wHTH) protein
LQGSASCKTWLMVRFGDVVVDVGGREVRRGGELVHLEPQAFDLLVVLLEHRDRVVSKNDLLDGVWGHRFVSDANLTTRVKEVRRAVGDDGARQHTIRNVRGRGYRFVADVDSVNASERVASTGALFGRDGDVVALLEALVDTPVVTLTGPGGVGKSTLARAVARLASARHAGGARVVELATLDRGEHVLPAVARALDVIVDVDRPDIAARSIAELDVLLVLDNCEHVVDDVGRLLDEAATVANGPGRVLATSQVRLGLSGEQVIVVHPLDLTDAVQLFTTRARAVSPMWAPEEVGSDRISRLMAGLDQLPLTIEMAAARLGSMTFDELELAVGYEGLTPVSHRSPVHRHRSVESLVTWSAELLDPRLRHAFIEFSVFAGPVGMADATAVVWPERPSAMFDLAALTERSLLVADHDGTATRYRMLSTVRTVATNWLGQSGKEDEARRRHAEHFAAAAALADLQIRGPDEAQGRQRLDDIGAEVRAAHFWAQSHEPELASDIGRALHLAAYSTFWNEPAEWSRLLLDNLPHAPADALVGARLMVAGVAANRGDLAEAREVATGVLTTDDARARATALEILSDVEIYAGHLDRVAQLTKELWTLGAQLADPHSMAISTVDAAIALAFDNQPQLALARLDELDLDAVSQSDRAWVLYARGEALRVAGETDAATALSEAIAGGRAIGNPFVTSVAQVSLAAEHTRSGRFADALDAYHDCLVDYARHGNFVHAVTTLRNLVAVLVAVGDDIGAAVIAAASSREGLRPSYGVEALRLQNAMALIEQRLGEERFAVATAEGRSLDVVEAVQVAVQLVDGHRN